MSCELFRIRVSLLYLGSDEHLSIWFYCYICPAVESVHELYNKGIIAEGCNKIRFCSVVLIVFSITAAQAVDPAVK